MWGFGVAWDPKPFSRRISTLSRKLSSQSSRADTQSKINAASWPNQRSLSCYVYLTAVRGALAASLAVPEHELRHPNDYAQGDGTGHISVAGHSMEALDNSMLPHFDQTSPVVVPPSRSAMVEVGAERPPFGMVRAHAWA
jgi:hypothetical protein